MNAVGRIGSYISRGVYSVSTPFHPFGGAVDIIVVEQPDGTFKSSPWYVRFGKFQGVMKTKEKVVNLVVNGVVMDFSMYLGNDGQACFLSEVDVEEGDNPYSPPPSSGEDTDTQTQCRKPMKSKSCDFIGVEPSSTTGRSGILGYVFGKKSIKERDANVIRPDSLERAQIAADLLEVNWSTNSRSPRCQVLNNSGQDPSNDSDNKQNLPIDDKVNDNTNSLDPHAAQEEIRSLDHTNICLFQEYNSKKDKNSAINSNYSGNSKSEESPKTAMTISSRTVDGQVSPLNEKYSQRVYLHPLDGSSEEVEQQSNTVTPEILELEQLIFGDLDDLSPNNIKDNILDNSDSEEKDVIESFVADRVKLASVRSDISISSSSKAQSDNLIRMATSLPTKWSHDTNLCSGQNHQKSPEVSQEVEIAKAIQEVDVRPVEPETEEKSPPTAANGESHRTWSFPFKRSNSTLVIRDSLNENINTDAKSPPRDSSECTEEDVPKVRITKKKIRALTPTSEQLASLNLKAGKNIVIFTFSTPMLGKQQVDAQIYLWKWDSRIVISDVDGTITRSDVLGQFMPLVGVDWSQTGVAHLFSAIKENGFQLLFLSARSISQAYVTRQFLINLMQDGKGLPEGPVIISPDGLFPSLFREVVRRAPHEFKIACLEDIKALFPSDTNPFYAGFGNRDTDEVSYLKVGIPKGKIFIINPKGEIVVNRHITNTKSYTSLHTLVNGMFPVVSSSEQEDYNSWNFWKLPPPSIR
ncbi:hypothetical protein DM860_013239 [Cuscuta australis]|uniref:LNS2/PITP domain-containing protein n=1 Tax=Cuscuta australis TaxID=267555 RepID=A0A328DNT7_9ASTE|nr:hypothetical protein DM860_013239 [Cuscuta australis]